MAALQTPGDVINVQFTDLKATDQVVGVWTVRLREASDTIVVPGLETTSGVGALSPTVTISAAAIAEGESTLTTLLGTPGDTFVFTTLHRVGMSNYLGIDEDPTVGGS